MRTSLLFAGLALVLLAGLAAMSGAGSLGGLWFGAAPASLNAAQALVQRHIAPALWTDAVVPLLRQPAWLVALVPGILLSIGGLAWRRR